MKIISRLRIKLRPYWLVFVRDVKCFFTFCERCGVLGAWPCSICELQSLCGDCQLEVNRVLSAQGTNKYGIDWGQENNGTNKTQSSC